MRVGQRLFRCLGIIWLSLIVAFVFGTVYVAVIVEQVIGEGQQHPLSGPQRLHAADHLNGRSSRTHPQQLPDEAQRVVVAAATTTAEQRKTATLHCPGLSPEQSNEMVYWQEIPSDRTFRSPFYSEPNDDVRDNKDDGRRYLTFVMDEGGYNNIRMAYETVLALCHAMGRTLVLPPDQEIYLFNEDAAVGAAAGPGQQPQQQPQQQRKDFGFQDFFPLERIAALTQSMGIITTEEFLLREAMTGKLRDRATGQICFPPHNRTNWNGDSYAIVHELQPWLQTVTYMPHWSPDHCLVAFPATRNSTLLQQKFNAILNLGVGFRSPDLYVANPTAVDGNTIDRLGEVLNKRTQLCVYNDQNHTKERVLHLHGTQKAGTRLLTHFYAFLFFEDWRHDLWTKRFIRDQLHYRDEIQCAAARIVAAIRYGGSSSNNGSLQYDAFHVRRGEFQYKGTRVTAQQMYEIARDQIPDNATVYIATDERDRHFFDDLAAHYHLLFLDDFRHLLQDVNTNFYGLIDQLVASRSRTFFGCWFSTYVSFNLLFSCSSTMKGSP
jgi:hypothetical protein